MYEPASAYFPLLMILLFLVVGVVYADLRSRRGWGLGLLGLALSAIGVWMTYIFVSTLDSPAAHDLAGGIILAVYFAIYLGLMLIVWLSALVVAGVSRHWGWLIGLFAAALIPALLIFAQVTLGLRAPGLNVISFDLTLAPAFTALAYGIARIVRPARPAAA